MVKYHAWEEVHPLAFDCLGGVLRHSLWYQFLQRAFEAAVGVTVLLAAELIAIPCGRDRALGLNGSLTEVTRQVENIRQNDDNLAATLAPTEEEVEKQLYHKIWVDQLGTLRADAIFSDMSRDLDENCATLAKKVHDMVCSAVANKTLTPTMASKALVKIGTKVSVSTLR